MFALIIRSTCKTPAALCYSAIGISHAFSQVPSLHFSSDIPTPTAYTWLIDCTGVDARFLSVMHTIVVDIYLLMRLNSPGPGSDYTWAWGNPACELSQIALRRTTGMTVFIITG